MSRYDEEVLVVALDKIIEVCDRIVKQGLSPWRMHRLNTFRAEAYQLRHDWKLEDIEEGK